MSIRRALAWLFGLGDGYEVEVPKPARAPARAPVKGPREPAGVQLYGEAEAIRVLYQSVVVDESPPKPPRPRGRRGRWVTQYLDSLSSPLSDTAGAKA